MSACACWGEGGVCPQQRQLLPPRRPVFVLVPAVSVSAPSASAKPACVVRCACVLVLCLCCLRVETKTVETSPCPLPPPLLIPRGFHERANRANPVRWLTVLCVHLQNCRFKLKKAPRAEMRECCEMLSFGGRQISRFMISFHGD